MSLPKLGQLLVQEGLLSAAQLAQMQANQPRTGLGLPQLVVKSGLVPERVLFDLLARASRTERLDLSKVRIQNEVARLVEAGWAQANGVIPLFSNERSRTIFVAIVDPARVELVDELQFRTGMRVSLYLASPTEIDRLVRHIHYGEALDRVPTSGFQRPLDVRFDESEVIIGIDGMREAVQSQDIDEEAQKRQLMELLEPIYQRHQESTKALRVIFELCIHRGIISRQEYLDRLRKADL